MNAGLSDNLIAAMHDPAAVLYTDEFVVIIADKYPKSKHHFLVLPHEHIADVCNLREHHVPKLIYMELKGLEYAMTVTGLPSFNFLVGYHAFPSKNRLHLHVLSKDFCSVHLQQSYQWNVFHTEFFIPTYKIISELQTLGHVLLPPNKRCLQQQLRCHKCDYFSNDVQHLKHHLSLFHSELQGVFL